MDSDPFKWTPVEENHPEPVDLEQDAGQLEPVVESTVGSHGAVELELVLLLVVT